MSRLMPLALVALFITGCSTLSTNDLEPGMTKAEITKRLGPPETRSFRGDSEAWQYQGVAGFGQCRYSTVWLTKGVVVAVTSRSGPSVAGCGLGSREVDWGQLPKPSIDINIKQDTKQSDAKGT
jgi:hypothetical protein